MHSINKNIPTGLYDKLKIKLKKKRANLNLIIPLLLLVTLRLVVAQQTSGEHEVRAAVSAFGRAFVEKPMSPSFKRFSQMTMST